MLCFAELAMRFTEGEEVLAKHPNTSDYYKGRILNVRGDRYKIKFETGAEYIVSENDIKVITGFIEPNISICCI